MKVYVTQELPMEVEEFLCEHVELIKKPENMPLSEVPAQLGEVDGLLTGGVMIDAALLDAAPRLVVVSDISAGYNNFDLDEMKKRGVIGTNTPGVVNDPVADLVIGLMIAAGRRIIELDGYMRKGLWKKGDNERLFGLEISGKILGILGMGGIGEALAKKARLAFGMEVLYHNRNPRAFDGMEEPARYCPLDELLKSSDYVVILTPLTDQTFHMIGKAELDLMKPTGILINAARGQVINEPELIEALREKRIYAAGLDVYEQEPIDKDNGLLSLSNVVLAPHIGTALTQARKDMAKTAAENIVDALEGRTPKNVVKELR